METRLKRFKEWFLSNGGYISPRCDFVYNNELGVHLKNTSSSDIAGDQLSGGEEVVRCPHHITLSALDADPELPAFDISKSRDSIRSINLPKGLLDAAPRPQCLGAVWLCVQRKLGTESFWEPYISMLPTAPKENLDELTGSCDGRETDLPVWWSDSEKAYFTGSPMEAGLRDLEAIWKADYDAIWSELQRLRTDSGLDITWPEFKWALSIFTSRAFPSSLLRHVRISHGQSNETGNLLQKFYDPHTLLYPGFDMLNHNPKTLNHWKTTEHGFSLICSDVVKQHEQIYNSYGSKTNGQLLLCFGFTLDYVKYDAFPLRLREQEYQIPLDFLQISRNTPTESWPEPHTPPPPHDPTMTAYYIRSATSLDHFDTPLPGYPKPGASQVGNSMLGIPLDLISRLSSLLMNERELMRVRDSRIVGDDRSNLREKPFCCLVSARATVAVWCLIYERLSMELKRLRTGLRIVKRAALKMNIESRLADNDERTAENVQIGVTHLNQTANHSRCAKRLLQAELYMASQWKILEGNLASLDVLLWIFLPSDKPEMNQLAFSPSLFKDETDTRKVFILNFTRAHKLLPEIGRQAFNAATRAFYESHSDQKEPPSVANLDHSDNQEDLWAIWIGIALLIFAEENGKHMLTKDETPNPNSKQDHIELTSCLTNLKNFYAAQGEEHNVNTNEGQTTLTHVRQIVATVSERVTEYCGGSDDEVRALWNTNKWNNPDFTYLCTSVVRDQTLSVPNSEVDSGDEWFTRLDNQLDTEQDEELSPQPRMIVLMLDQ